MTPDQVSAWADSITAGATIVAVGIAFVAGVIARRVLDVEQERDRVRDEDRRASQAERVAAWLHQVDVSVHSGIGPDRPENYVMRRAWGATIYNGSDVPVYDARVFCTHPTMGNVIEKLRVVPPSNQRDPFSYVTFASLRQTDDEEYVGDRGILRTENSSPLF